MSFSKGILMRIRTLVLGAYQTNSYVLRPDDSSDGCVVVDTGLSAETLTAFLQTKSLTPKALILTHGHGDHIAGVPEVLALWPELPIYAHQLEADVLLNPNLNLSTMTGMPMTLDGEIHYVVQDQIIEAAGITLKVLHTPGHTPGGMSLYGKEKGAVFAGDTLFTESVGRTDFPGGSQTVLVKSIQDQLFVLPDETRVYPGHGPSTTIGHEKQHNPYVR
ncbi:MAG: MBL fold metallo-hydrolase [Planctomycetes bacterium]|nr:MBL fold metallo-hydrolase [Planctomycetota bacterium]